MPKMVYGQSAAGIDPKLKGRHVCKFVGTEDRDPIGESQYGNSDAPRMAWLFEIQDGQFKGERIAAETGCKAAPKSACIRIVSGLAGGQVQVGQTVDTDQYVGKLYSVKVEVNPQSPKGNLHVADLEPLGAAPGGPAPAPPPRPASGPPPKPNGPPTQKEGRFWAALYGKTSELYTRAEIQAAINTAQGGEDHLDVCPEGEQLWRKAHECGFTPVVPF